jgi:ABC-type multidrug transport system fused ATPase/permease subunit
MVEIDPVQEEMKMVADVKDEKWIKHCDEVMEEENKVKGFSKLWPYQRPLIILPVAIICSILSGICHLSVGITFSKMMPILAIPMEHVKKVYPEYVDETAKEILQQRTMIWVGLMVSIAVILGIATLIGRISYATLGTNCTLSIRQLLYKSILEKNMGWFDFAEHGVSVVTSAMASDTQLVNGTATESLSP